MKKNYILPILFGIIFTIIFSCSDDNSNDEYTPVSPVTVDLTQVPYAKLSDYKFFEGELKNLSPALGVLPL